MMTTWRDYLLNKCHTHTWMIYIPGLPGDLDYPEILGLRAPLPTLVQNDLEDQLFTVPEMRRADRILSEVYAKAGAGDRYKCSFYPGPHKFDGPMQAEAFAWFEALAQVALDQRPEMIEASSGRSRFGMPEANGPVVCDRAQDRSVGRERQPIDLGAVGGQAKELLAGDRVPEPDRPLDPGRGERRAVGAERQLSQLAAITVDQSGSAWTGPGPRR